MERPVNQSEQKKKQPKYAASIVARVVWCVSRGGGWVNESSALLSDMSKVSVSCFVTPRDYVRGFRKSFTYYVTTAAEMRHLARQESGTMLAKNCYKLTYSFVIMITTVIAPRDTMCNISVVPGQNRTSFLQAAAFLLWPSANHFYHHNTRQWRDRKGRHSRQQDAARA